MSEENNQRNAEIVYEEWVPVGRVVKVAMLSVFILIISIGIITTAFIPREFMFISIIFGAVSLLILLLYWNFRGIRILMTNNQLEVKYGIFNHKEIPLQEISNCEETKASFKRYGGIGIRLGFDGSWAYNTDFGEAVKLSFKTGRPFVFSTRNPQKICNLVKELLKEK